MKDNKNNPKRKHVSRKPKEYETKLTTSLSNAKQKLIHKSKRVLSHSRLFKFKKKSVRKTPPKTNKKNSSNI